MKSMGEASSTILWRLKMTISRNPSLFGSMEVGIVGILAHV